MSYFEIVMIGIGLSMDAFAAAICKGLSMRRAAVGSMLTVGLFFGGFQALMPALGYLLGTRFEQYIVSVDHWIAFALLSFIGGKMIFDALRETEEEKPALSAERLDLRELLLLAVATSIDALAVGVSFAFLGVNIGLSCALIGLTTFAISAAGVAIGHRFGARYKKKAAVTGGVILILIGIKILLEHLGYL